ncbi:MAG: hypothetical protein CM15mP49_21790 [Actinomycetota bacterium]|nr:MAG: hypothetical protein CM15mP49_21790 [Actinomycetota bacterium]
MPLPRYGHGLLREHSLIFPELGTSPMSQEESHQLPEMSVAIWEGFVFVNFDQDAQPLEEYLGVSPRALERLATRRSVH